MAKGGFCKKCDVYRANLHSHEVNIHERIVSRMIIEEQPTLCDCEEPNPIPQGMGECGTCHRLIRKYAWTNGEQPKLPK